MLRRMLRKIVRRKVVRKIETIMRKGFRFLLFFFEG